MAEYALAHGGINASDTQAAVKADKLFGLTVKEGNSAFFSGGAMEIMKAPCKGTHGHIAAGTPDAAAAQAEPEEKGFAFDSGTVKYTAY